MNILVVFSLDIGQISFNLVEKVFGTRHFALLATGIAFCDILALGCAEIKIFIYGSFLFPSLFVCLVYFEHENTSVSASLAQWLEHWSCKPGVESSNLSRGCKPERFFRFLPIPIDAQMIL